MGWVEERGVVLDWSGPTTCAEGFRANLSVSFGCLRCPVDFFFNHQPFQHLIGRWRNSKAAVHARPLVVREAQCAGSV